MIQRLSSMLTSVATYLQSCLDQDTITVARVRHIMITLNNIKTLSYKINKLNLSDHEFAYLRLCLLFKTSNNN